MANLTLALPAELEKAISETRAVSEQEMQVAFSGPAPLVNKFFIVGCGSMARIAFAEEAPGVGPVFRSAVSMSVVDLLRLKAAIERVTANIVLQSVPNPAQKDG